MAGTSQRHYRTIWISDIHLGTRGCQAESLLDFLRSVECDTMYLVGDVIDFWRMRRALYWPQSHNDGTRSPPPVSTWGKKPGRYDDERGCPCS